jgi:hypothetical protein
MKLPTDALNPIYLAPKVFHLVKMTLHPILSEMLAVSSVLLLSTIIVSVFV